MGPGLSRRRRFPTIFEVSAEAGWPYPLRAGRLLVDDLRRGYRQAHPGQEEGDDYTIAIFRNPDGRSGFVKADRVENTDQQTTVRSTTLVIQDNRVVGRITTENCSYFF